MGKFICAIDVEAYCFVPINPDKKCKHYAQTKGFFGMRTPHCKVFMKELKSAASPYTGVILPCEECEQSKKHISDVGEQQTTAEAINTTGDKLERDVLLASANDSCKHY